MSDNEQAAALEWRLQAACRGMDYLVFYPAAGQSAAKARAVCRTCPVVEPCREYALAHPEMFGFWGGLSERERRWVRRQRRQAAEQQQPEVTDSAR